MRLLPHEKQTQTEYGETALMRAAEIGHTEMVRLLLEHERGMQSNGWTALMWAAQRGLSEIVEILAPHESGRSNSRGECALILAMEYGHRGCVPHLLRGRPCHVVRGSRASRALELCRRDPTGRLGQTCRSFEDAICSMLTPP